MIAAALAVAPAAFAQEEWEPAPGTPEAATASDKATATKEPAEAARPGEPLKTAEERKNEPQGKPSDDAKPPPPSEPTAAPDDKKPFIDRDGDGIQDGQEKRFRPRRSRSGKGESEDQRRFRRQERNGAPPGQGGPEGPGGK